MRKVCPYWLTSEPALVEVQDTCASCRELPDAVLDEISILLHEARNAAAPAQPSLQAPLYQVVRRDVRLTAANVNVLIALGLRPSLHALLFLGVCAIERDVRRGRRAV